MTTYTSVGAASPKLGGDDGNCYIDYDRAYVPATFTTTDKARLLQVPGGVKLHKIVIRNDDLDAGATITANFGYEAADAGSTLTAAPTAFASAATILRGAAVTEYYLAEPIVFNEPVWITAIPAAGPATTAGYIRCHAFGELVGIK